MSVTAYPTHDPLHMIAVTPNGKIPQYLHPKTMQITDQRRYQNTECT